MEGGLRLWKWKSGVKVINVIIIWDIECIEEVLLNGGLRKFIVVVGLFLVV